MQFKRPPINEMSLAVRWASQIEITPDLILSFRDRVASELPSVELHPLVSDHAGIILSSPGPLTVRWFLTEPAGSLFAQFQGDLYGFNWRKRTAILEPDPTPYPGFDDMASAFWKHLSAWRAHLEENGGVAPQPRSCSLYYDNLWLLPEDSGSVSEVFAFWNSMGIRTSVLGPNVTFAVVVDVEEGRQMKTDVGAVLGTLVVDNAQKRVARVTFNSSVPADADEPVKTSFRLMHDHIIELLSVVMTSSTKEAWSG